MGVGSFEPASWPCCWPCSGEAESAPPGTAALLDPSAAAEVHC